MPVDCSDAFFSPILTSGSIDDASSGRRWEEKFTLFSLFFSFFFLDESSHTERLWQVISFRHGTAAAATTTSTVRFLKIQTNRDNNYSPLCSMIDSFSHRSTHLAVDISVTQHEFKSNLKWDTADAVKSFWEKFMINLIFIVKIAKRR